MDGACVVGELPVTLASRACSPANWVDFPINPSDRDVIRVTERIVRRDCITLLNYNGAN